MSVSQDLSLHKCCIGNTGLDDVTTIGRQSPKWNCPPHAHPHTHCRRNIRHSGEKIYRYFWCSKLYICLIDLLCLWLENNATRTPLPFWGVVIEYLLSLHGKTRGTSYFSEYELYFQYIRRMHPETIVHRPLFFSNGPAPGLLFTARPREYKTGTVLEVNGRNAFSRGK